MAPAAGCPAEEIFCHLRDGAVPRRPRGPTGSAPPGAAPAAWPQEPQLASAIPFQVPQGAVGWAQVSPAGLMTECRLGAPRGDRFPRLQLFSVHQGGGISCCSVSGLASGQSSTEPILRRRAAEATDAFGHTTDETTRWAVSLAARFGSSYESLVTEATRPARLFKGPRNKNRTRYGTRLGCHDPKAARRSYGLVRSERPLRAPPSPTYRQLSYWATAQRPSTSLTKRRAGPNQPTLHPLKGTTWAAGLAVPG